MPANQEITAMTEAEEKKLEAADRKDRKDEERDMGEDPIETTEGKRRDGQDEEIPAWADALAKRLDAMEKALRPKESADRKDGDEKEHDAGERAAGMEEEKRRLEDRKDRRDESEEEHKKEDRKDSRRRKDTEGDTDEDTDREDRARRDAQVLAANRRLQAEIDELKARMGAVYREPTIEDRNALAETRAKADAL
ncbi:MAG: hypothetical protein ACP5D5_09165, partial [Acidithiobacillus sp.]|uniref:hypothetical protein n=1 Tax=Acidithiobacillus sp. TaxID=1872118 RepID=UPI003D05E119